MMPKKQPPSTSFLSQERERSKATRVLIKGVIRQLNECVTDVKLNNNTTLQIAVAVSKLNSFYKYNTLESVKRNSDPVTVDDFLNIDNSVGFGFSETGIILYATDQLKAYFKRIMKATLIGFHLSKICINSSQILNQVFTEKKKDILLQIKKNCGSKSSYDIFLTGKQMINSSKQAMFLCYSTIKPFDVPKNPSCSISGCYMVTNPTTLQVIKGKKRI